MSIFVSNLSKNYGQQKAVNNISFSLKKNEIVGFLGPNGAGKSTTMKMITGYLSPDSGEIKVCDHFVSTNSITSKKKIGYLPEANPLYHEMYVREYLFFVANVHAIENKKTRIEEVINLVGLSVESHKKIGQLSKGYKQRVGIAAALIHNPEVLILDEPTSGLDPNQIIEIREVIKKLGEEKTILFSSHIMQEVESICERVIIINKGEIVANSTIDELKSQNKNTHFVAVEFKDVVEKSIFNALNDIINVHQKNNNSFLFETENPDSLRKQLIEWSLHKHVDIISLTSEKQDLESIFKSLTT